MPTFLIKWLCFNLRLAFVLFVSLSFHLLSFLFPFLTNSSGFLFPLFSSPQLHRPGLVGPVDDGAVQEGGDRVDLLVLLPTAVSR